MEVFSRQSHRLGESPDLSRRNFLARTLPAAVTVPALTVPAPTGAAGAATGAAGPAGAGSHLGQGARMESRLFAYEDPFEHQRQSYRILRNTLDDADVLFWYHFTMFSVPEGRAPQPVVRWEGIEFSHHRKLAEGVYRVHGHNLSFPRDLRSGQWTDTAVNPVTGEEVRIPPMALTEDPGYVYLPEGVVPLDKPDAPPRTRVEQFLIEDDLVKIEQVRLPPASWPATFVETSANWSSRALFEASDQPSLPTGTAGGYVFPWPAWMGMEGLPGHMFATWHGRKLEGIGQLPEEFLRRAEPEHQALLAVDLGVFDTPLPPPLRNRVSSPR
jgi:hypothetical protein